MERGPKLSIIEQARLGTVMDRYAKKHMMQPNENDEEHGEGVNDMQNNEKWHGWARSDGPNTWKMDRYARSTEQPELPIPEASVEEMVLGPEASGDLTPGQETVLPIEGPVLPEQGPSNPIPYKIGDGPLW